MILEHGILAWRAAAGGQTLRSASSHTWRCNMRVAARCRARRTRIRLMGKRQEIGQTGLPALIRRKEASA
jgi:hypothetical protein